VKKEGKEGKRERGILYRFFRIQNRNHSPLSPLL